MAFNGDLAQLWADDEAPPPKTLDVLTQIAHFLDQLGYTKTFSALYKEAKKNDLIIDIAEWERGIQAKTAIPLLDLYEEWYDGNEKFPTLPESEDEAGGAEDSSSDSSSDDESERDPAEGVMVDVEAEETSDDGSDKDSSSSSDSDDSDASPTKAGVKRKRAATPSSSDDSSSDSESDSDSSSSSSDSDARPAKKTKVEGPASSASGSDSSSSGSDSDSSSSSSDSGSDSDSASDESDSSDSDSSSDSDGEEEKPKETKPKAKTAEKKKKKGVESIKTTVASTPSKDAGSQSSATLEGESAGEKENDSEEPGHVHPDRLKQVPSTKPTKKEIAAGAKKQQVPFSRIPSDQKVDPRFASNEYVSYDYADRAYRDLSVTKGKGFTKEKNKKKRGAYRGGMIDFTPKGIKFDD